MSVFSNYILHTALNWKFANLHDKVRRCWRDRTVYCSETVEGWELFTGTSHTAMWCVGTVYMCSGLPTVKLINGNVYFCGSCIFCIILHNCPHKYVVFYHPNFNMPRIGTKTNSFVPEDCWHLKPIYKIISDISWYGAVTKHCGLPGAGATFWGLPTSCSTGIDLVETCNWYCCISAPYNRNSMLQNCQSGLRR